MNIWLVIGIIYINIWILRSISMIGKKVEIKTHGAGSTIVVGLFLTIAFVLGYLAGMG